jgi:23S rRNA pseudouridine2605 synthase
MVRLNKYLASCGVGARRKIDALIAEGKVSVDGRRAVLGESIDPDAQRISVQGRTITPPAREHVTLILNKPAGVITTMSDERGRMSVSRLLPGNRRLFPVGRLDAATTGVLLCTTDGELARILTHPSFGVEKRYRVRAAGDLSTESKMALGAGPVRRSADGTSSFDIILREGKNRQVRRMCAQQGLRVLALERIKFGPIELGRLELGKTRELTQAEHTALERIRAAAAGDAGPPLNMKIKKGRPPNQLK